jgi:hypothetical protein
MNMRCGYGWRSEDAREGVVDVKLDGHACRRDKLVIRIIRWEGQ